MAMVHISQQLNPAAIKQLLQSPQGAVGRDMLRRGLLVETRAKLNLNGGGGKPKRVDTGRLRASISTQLVMVNGAPVAYVSTNVNYAMFVHDGTGIYGPRHRVITPRNRKFMRFKTKGSAGRYVYARKVVGMRANPFLRDALAAARG